MSASDHKILWVKDLKMHEVSVCEWQGVRYFAPLEQAFKNHKVRKIKGRVGRFTGTYFMGLHYYSTHSFGKQEILFKLDRKTMLDRNANGKLLDEVLLLTGISAGVRAKKPQAIILSAIGYGASSGMFAF